MEQVLAKAAKLVAQRAEKVAEALVETARAELPRDLKVEKFDRQIVIEGKALAKRALTEAALRGLSLLVKAVLK